MNGWVRLAAPVALAGLLVGMIATPAHADTVLDHGHVDVFDIAFSDDTVDLKVLAYNDTGVPGLYEPEDVTIEVALEFTVPGTWDICATGTAWVLPQAAINGLVWAGWNAADVEGGVVSTITLDDIDNPSGGDTGFCVYTASGGGVATTYLDDDGSPSSFTVNAGAHTHANWTFDNPGTYVVTITVSAGGDSEQHDFKFEVIDS